MITIRLRLRGQKGAIRRLIIALILALLAGMLAGGRPTSAELPPEAEGTTQTGVERRSFYLTDDNHDADKATSACGPGYHMASLWEILDVSNLAYAYDHPDAHTKTDSGQGPPAQWYGWVRTGYASSTVGTPGIGNCQSWTSTDSGHDGTIARLTYDWESAGTVVGPWDTDAFACTGISPVWCVEDAARVRQVFAPIVLR